MYTFYDPVALLSSTSFFHHLSQILRSALVASQELASIVEVDLLKVLDMLLTSENNSSSSSSSNNNTLSSWIVSLRSTITAVCVETFTIASRLNGSLYGRVLAVLREHIAFTKSWEGIDASQLSKLVVALALSLSLSLSLLLLLLLLLFTGCCWLLLVVAGTFVIAFVHLLFTLFLLSQVNCWLMSRKL